MTTTKDLDKSIKSFLSLELSRLDSIKSPFLQHGKMGVALFSYWLYEKNRLIAYKDIADTLLDAITKEITSNSLLEIYNGVCGIGLSIIYLYKKNFINEHPDAILSNIDNHIYINCQTAIAEYNTRYVGTYLDILLYLSCRIPLIQDPVNKRIFTNLWFDLYNKIYFNINSDFFIEPNPAELKYNYAEFLLISALGVNLSEYIKNRIVKILKEIELYCIPYFPYLHFNRLTLSLSIAYLRNSLELDSKWELHQHMLENSISLSHIISCEIYSNDIYMSHGFPCLYYLLKQHKAISDSLIFNELETYSQIKIAIKNSIIFNENYDVMNSFKYYGLDGILGSLMTLKNIEYDEKI